MTALAIATGISAVVALIYQFQYVGAEPSIGRSLVKTSAVLVLLAGLFLSVDVAPSTIDLPTISGSQFDPLFFVCAALVFSAIGDFCLSRDGWNATGAGIISFGMAQIAYIIALVVMIAGLPFPPDWVRYALPTIAALGVVILPRVIPLTVRVLMMIYAVLLLVMAWFGVISGSQYLAIGAILFVLSDLLIAVGMDPRLPGRMRRISDQAVWTIYWLAQALLVWGFY
ncbi:MAG: lysoplasmalogenase family protein, partial [Pseudomonadota bacterium]